MKKQTRQEIELIDLRERQERMAKYVKILRADNDELECKLDLALNRIDRLDYKASTLGIRLKLFKQNLIALAKTAPKDTSELMFALIDLDDARAHLDGEIDENDNG